LALGWVLRNQTFMLMVFFATVAGTILLYMVVPKGFFPQQDTGSMMGPPRPLKISPSEP
jgi:multidrug efflux pump subunit AcrB